MPVCPPTHTRLELCSFSGYKIHPGHGRFYVRTDGESLPLLSLSLCRSLSHCAPRLTPVHCSTHGLLPLGSPFRHDPPSQSHPRAGRQVFFLNHKVTSLYFQRKNPRKIAWTVLYRRKRRKGITEEVKSRKTRRTQKFQRAIEVSCWSAPTRS